MRSLYSLVAFFLGILTTQAQDVQGRIIGQVKDGSQKILESSTIALLKAADSSTVKYSVADKEGRFAFENINTGNYIVAITALGHKKAFSESFSLNEAHPLKDLKVIELVTEAKTMGTITVTAKKPFIEQKTDRTVVNVEASITNAGSSALEVLEKSPGVSVDKDGNISLKGKEGVLVLVDGRPTQLSGADLASLLRNMNANQLDQIEIMTNPPAKFDAAGNAGVINIKTKKLRQQGQNGSFNLGYGQGKYPRFNEGLNMNYNVGKVNLFTSLSHNYRKDVNQLDLKRKIRNNNTKELENYFDQVARMRNEFNSYNAKLGMDYFASKKTTLGVVFSGYSNSGTFGNRNLNLISDPDYILESQTKATADYKQSRKNFSTNLNFRTQLDSTGRELTSDLDYITYSSRNDQVLINSYYDPFGDPTQKADTLLGALPQDISIYSGKIDYVQPLKKGARFEAGVKTSVVKTDNNARYDSIQFAQIVHDYNRSNYFIYHENINAAYANYNTPLGKKFSTQLGLRLENTWAKGNQVTTGEKFERKYTQLFPTAYFQYKADEKNSFVLNYGRRIRRPNYESLNPFIKFLDRYTYQQGNPNLKPQFSNNFEFSHTYKNFLTTTLNYSLTNDIIQQVIEQKGKEAYVKQSNIARQRQYGIAVSANHSITSWWTNSVYVNVFNNRFSGVVDSTVIVISGTSLMLNGSQQFKFSKTWNAELSGFYMSGALMGVMRIHGSGMLSVGIGKQIMKNKGSIRLNVRDIFKLQSERGDSKYGNVDVSFHEYHDTRSVNLGFTYRFSKGKTLNQRKRNNGSASEEQNRVGGGN